MRLCVVLPSVPHYRKELFTSLSKEELMEEVVVLGGYGSSRKVVNIIDDPVGFEVCLQELRSISIRGLSIKYQQGLLSMIVKEKPTHVLMLYHMSVLNHSFVPIVCKILGIKVYFWGSGSGEDASIRGLDFEMLIKLKLLYKKWFYGFFDGIVVYSKKHHDRLRSQRVGQPICVAQNTTNIDHLLNIALNQEKNRNFLFIGALESVKRLDILIRALSKIDTADWRLDIIGAGSKRLDLENLSQNLNIDDKIRFHGALYNEETMSFWHCASYVVLPGVGGLLINEAMAAGKYVLATSGDGTGEDLLEGEDLLMHNVTDSDLAVRIDELLSLTSDEYFSRCKRNRMYAMENLRIETMKNSMLNFLIS